MKNLLLLFVSFILFINTASAQDDAKVKVTAASEKSPVSADEVFNVKVTVELKKPWYTYSMEEQINAEGIGPMPTEFFAEPGDAVEISGDVAAPETDRKFDAGFEMDIDYYKNTVEFIVPLLAKRDLDFSKDSIEIGIFAQLCDSSSCLPPLSYSAYISEETVEIRQADEGAIQTDSSREIDEAKEGGIFSFLWFAMGAGALSLLTPCVFPMIPITVSFFTKRAEEAKGKGLRDSIVYALGIIITFTLIGFLVSLLFGATGIRDMASSIWVNLFITLIFLIFAFNLFGAFEIQIPPKLMNALNQKSQSGGGILSVLLMGLTFSLASFTCTVPFVGAALVSASGGEWFYPIIGMIGFSTVLAAPFFLLALFPSFLQKMPKAGGWMNNVKVVMGFLVIAATMKFISNMLVGMDIEFLTRELFLSIWIAAGIMITFYILGKFRLGHDSPVDAVGSVRIVIALIFASISVWLFTGLFGKSMGELDAFLPTQTYGNIAGMAAPALSTGGNAQTAEKANWFVNDYEAALAEAKSENKNILIDFTGYFCTNCKWMESRIFPLPAVAEKFQNFVKVKLYTDKKGEPYKSHQNMQQERFGSIDLPLYVLITPDEKVIATKTFTRDEQEFIEFLEKGI